MTLRCLSILLMCIILVKLGISSKQSKDYRHIGCFLDKGERAIPIWMGVFRHPEPQVVIQLCADRVKAMGYTVFSLQYGMECWSGPDAGQTYDKYGPADNCKDGLGGGWASDVYTFNVCRHVSFFSPIINKALLKHVIEEHTVENDNTCGALCYLNNDCVSYNLGPSQAPGMKVCQLNNADRYRYPQDYQDKPGYSYRGSQIKF